MEIRREAIGVSAGHEAQEPAPVETFTLDTGTGLAVTVWTLGASLVEVLVADRSGRRGNVVVRLPDLAAYEAPGNRYLGATLGRYARCIAGGVLSLDGRQYVLDSNEGEHHVHGGSIGFDRFVWQAEAGREANVLTLRLWLDRPDGDQGYPGAIHAETTYIVEPERLTFAHRATATALTVVALTNHASWNLAGARTIDGHRLAINAERALIVDEELIPVGDPVPVGGGPLDFASARTIGGERLDHSFVLDDPAWAAELEEPASGRVMRVVTDQPGLQVYSGDVLDPARAGICLQTGAWPDSPNRPHFPSSRLAVGETYRHVTTHEFSVR